MASVAGSTPVTSSNSLKRDSIAAIHQSHKLGHVGSTPTPATSLLGRSLVWLKRLSLKQKSVGSSPTAPAKNNS